MSHSHWTNYWRSGVSDSFGLQQPLWYTQVIEPFWRQVFTSLPDRACILDIATGNGAVARLAAEVASQTNKSFEIIAADKAELNPDINDLDAVKQSIRFLPQTPVEQLDLPDRQFDLISSQFGIEYANHKASLSAIQKHLKPGGRLIIIAHHQDSLICQQSRDELQQYRKILDQQPVFRKLASLIKVMGDLRTPVQLQALKNNTQAQQQRESFNHLVSKLMTQYPQGLVIGDLLTRINPLFKDKMLSPLAEKLRYIEIIQNNLQQGRLRLQDQLSAAWNEKELHKFIVLAEKSGFHCEHKQPLTNTEGNSLAWEIRLGNHDT